MNSHAAVGHLSANEAGSDNGVGLTRGARRLAEEDAARSAWLDARIREWREEAEEAREAQRKASRRRRSRRRG